MRRSIVANTKINKGELFTEQNLSVKRAGGYGLPPELWDFIINKSAQRDYKEDELI